MKGSQIQPSWAAIEARSMSSVRKRHGKRKAGRNPVNGLFRRPTSAGRPGDFIDQTIAIWQPRSERRLTREDGREIIENISGFFRILQEWDRAERKASNAAQEAEGAEIRSSEPVPR
jgi:hypothetical protein